MHRKAGNPFSVNATIAPVSPPHSPVTAPPGTPVSGVPSFGHIPTKQGDQPTAKEESNSGKSKNTTSRVIWMSIAGILVFIILGLGLVLFIPKCGRRERLDKLPKEHKTVAYGGDKQNHQDYRVLVQPSAQTEEGKCIYFWSCI